MSVAEPVIAWYPDPVGPVWQWRGECPCCRRTFVSGAAIPGHPDYDGPVRYWDGNESSQDAVDLLDYVVSLAQRTHGSPTVGLI